MKSLTPAAIAEEAIGLFLERLQAIDGTQPGIGLDEEAVDIATAQAISEIAEGTSVILPDEQQRLDAAEELLAACKKAMKRVEHRNNLHDMDCTATLRAAIRKAEAIRAT